MIAHIKAGKLKGNIEAVPSKSYLHRLLICAALGSGESKIGNYVKSEDILASIDCLRSLGADVKEDGNTLIVRGIGSKILQNAIFPCRESGSTMRFFIPVAAAKCETAVFRGSERLMERGVGVYEDILPDKGVIVKNENGEICVSGHLHPGEYEVRGDISSQYITGLLMALPMLTGDSIIRVLPPVESRAYIDITIDVLRTAGIGIIEKEKNIFYIKGGQKYGSVNTDAEGDWSNAAFLLAMNGLGAEIKVTGLNENSVQGDRVCAEDFARLDTPGATVDVGECIDLGPVLFAYAAAKCGGHFTGTRRLRIKESDRAVVMAEELSKLGVKVTVGENDVTVEAGKLTKPAECLDGHNDHRIVMALTVLLTLTGGSITGAEAVRKSYPAFFEDMRRLGLDVEIR